MFRYVLYGLCPGRNLPSPRQERWGLWRRFFLVLLWSGDQLLLRWDGRGHRLSTGVDKRVGHLGCPQSCGRLLAGRLSSHLLLPNNWKAYHVWLASIAVSVARPYRNGSISRSMAFTASEMSWSIRSVPRSAIKNSSPGGIRASFMPFPIADMASRDVSEKTLSKLVNLPWAPSGRILRNRAEIHPKPDGSPGPFIYPSSRHRSFSD